jgi:integrase
VDLLSNGVSLEEAAKLGGHRNSQVTEKYYGAWIKKRQDQAEEAVTRIWAKDPVVVAGMKTEGVQ